MRPLDRAPTLVTLAAAAAMLVYGPIEQFANYHDLADRRVVFGVPYAGDVLSNAGFAVVGLWGLRRLWTSRGVVPAPSLPGYALFCGALVLTALGSTYYHLAPNDARLFWDRLPIALAVAGLLASVRAEARPVSNAHATTLVLATLGVLSVLWWPITDRLGTGDLRPYLLLQALALVLIPLWQASARAPRSERLAVGAAILLYVAARAAEVSDHAVYATLGVVSGHTLKHLLATAAAAVLVRALVTGVHRSRDDLVRSIMS